MSFLGLAAANAACRGKRLPDIEGSLVDQFHQTGHLLRGPPLPRASETTLRIPVLVVGAGAAGLSAGWRMARSGFTDFLVAELDDTLGGTSQSGRNAVSQFPWGAHYLPAPLNMSGPVPKLLQDMQLIEGVDETGAPQFAEHALVADPEERLFFQGTWYEGQYLRAGASQHDLETLARFETLMNAFAARVDAQQRKVFTVPLELGSVDAEWAALDRMSMAQWLESQQLVSERLKWLVDYACRDDYGTTSEHTSAYAGIWYFASRHSGSEKSEGFLSWPEGNGRLIRQLAQTIGAERILKNVLIHSIDSSGDTAVVHGWHAVDQKPLRIEAQQVVLACPRFVAAHVVEQWKQSPPAFIKSFQYGPWVVANLTLKERPRGRGFPLCWDNVIYGSKSLGYVNATHQQQRADEHGPTVLTWYYPLAGADVREERTRLLATTHRDWVDIILADLVPAHLGLRELIERIDVMRWGHAMIRPVPGFLFSPEKQEAAQSLKGRVHFAHSDLGGLALFEEANFHGVRAAEQALAGLGRTEASWLK